MTPSASSAALVLSLTFFSLFAARALAAEPPEAGQPPDEDRGAETEKLQVYEEIQVTSRASDMLGVADSASEGVTGHADLEKRPILRPGELLETVPGVIITQHSGGGKANQYFLRGFNLDHGTEFRITVDGMPVNMPTRVRCSRTTPGAPPPRPWSTPSWAIAFGPAWSSLSKSSTSSMSDIDYFYESQLRGEAEPTADLHFHPAEKRSARLSAQWRF